MAYEDELGKLKLTPPFSPNKVPPFTERDRLAESAPISFGDVLRAFPEMNPHNGADEAFLIECLVAYRYMYADAMLRERGNAK